MAAEQAKIDQAEIARLAQIGQEQVNIDHVATQQGEQVHAEQARLALEQAEQERLERELADKEHYLVVSSQVSIKGDLTQDDPLAVEKSVGELVEQETVDTAGHDSADEVSTNPEDLNDKEEKVSKKKAKKDRQKQNRITEDDK